MWTTKPRKYKNDDVKTLNWATVSNVSRALNKRALNKRALARVSLITTNTVHGICPKYQRILCSKSPSQRSLSSVPYSRTTFKSNSTWSSDQIKLSKLFFFDLDDRSTEFGIFVAARNRINTKFLPIFSQRVMTRVCNCKK